MPWKAEPIPAPHQLVLEQRLLQSLDPWHAPDPMSERIPLPIPPATLRAGSQQMQFTVTTTASVSFPPDVLPAALQAMGTMGMAHLAWQARQGQPTGRVSPARPRSLSPAYGACAEVEDPWQPMAQPTSTVARQASPVPQSAAAAPSGTTASAARCGCRRCRATTPAAASRDRGV